MIDVPLSPKKEVVQKVVAATNDPPRSILFPVTVTLLMAALNSSWSVTAGCVRVMQQRFNISSEWWVNSVNFSYYWIYLIIGFPPILRRITGGTSRGNLLISACSVSMGGLLMQLMWSYDDGGFLYLWTGGVLISLPQPIILSNLATITTQYASPEHLGLGLGTFMTINGLISNLVYLATLMLIQDIDSFNIWFTPLLGFALALTVICCILTCVYTYYNVRLDSLWPYSLVVIPRDVQQLPGCSCLHGISTVYNLAGFCAFLISCSLLQGCGSAVGAIFEQLITAVRLEGTTLLMAVLLCSVPTIPLPALIGWITDTTKQTRIIPFVVVLVQVISQIFLFYGPAHDTIIAFMIYITLFTMAETALTVVFLQSLITLSGWSDSQVNGWLFWLSNMSTAIMSLSLFDAHTVVASLGPLFVVTGVVSLMAYAWGIYSTWSTTISPPSSPIR